MSDQLHFRNVPAISFPFIQLPQAQLDFLLSNTRSLLETLERAKKGVVVLDHFQTRLRGKQVVRCTPQSVRVTAAARYAPNPDDLNLSSITTTLFVHLITYLPLPEIRVLAGNHDALHEASKISMNEDIDQRWGTYYTCLGSVDKERAQLFFNEIQKQLASSEGGTDLSARIDNHFNSDRIIVDSTVPAIPLRNESNTTVELSQDATNQQQEEPFNHEKWAITTNTEDITPAADDPQWRNTHLTSDNDDTVRLQQEEKMYIRVLQAKEKAWGPDHPTTLDTVKRLAEFYTEHGKIREAEAMYKRIFGVSEGHVEVGHPEH